MVLLNGRFPKIGFFLAQLCLDTQVRGDIGKNVAFSISSIARKTMVDMLYGAPQWKIPQAWFLSFSIVSTYSTTMTNEIFYLMLLKCKKKNGALQWEPPQAWFLSFSIVSRYSSYWEDWED